MDFWLGQQSQKLKQKNYGVTPEAYPLRSFVPYGPRIRKCIGVKCIASPRELKSAAFHFNTKASPRQCLFAHSVLADFQMSKFACEVVESSQIAKFAPEQREERLFSRIMISLLHLHLLHTLSKGI